MRNKRGVSKATPAFEVCKNLSHTTHGGSHKYMNFLQRKIIKYRSLVLLIDSVEEMSLVWGRVGAWELGYLNFEDSKMFLSKI